jgi:hypothetical protein
MTDLGAPESRTIRSTAQLLDPDAGRVKGSTSIPGHLATDPVERCRWMEPILTPERIIAYG